MYQVIIDFKKTIPPAQMARLTETANKAFDNRAGRTENVSINPYRCIYEGGEELYGCLQLGFLALEDVDGFKESLSSWLWIDEEPNENSDILAELYDA